MVLTTKRGPMARASSVVPDFSRPVQTLYRVERERNVGSKWHDLKPKRKLRIETKICVDCDDHLILARTLASIKK